MSTAGSTQGTRKSELARGFLVWLARVWLACTALMLAVEWLNSSFDLGWLTRIYFWSTLLTSGACFVAYGVDKRRASRGKNRVSEKQLHLLAILGGWPGAVMGQQMFRHKTLKLSFRVVLWAIIAVHVGLSGYFVYSSVRQKQRRDAESVSASVRVRRCSVFPGENFPIPPETRRVRVPTHQSRVAV